MRYTALDLARRDAVRVWVSAERTTKRRRVAIFQPVENEIRAFDERHYIILHGFSHFVPALSL